MFGSQDISNLKLADFLHKVNLKQAVVMPLIYINGYCFFFFMFYPYSFEFGFIRYATLPLRRTEFSKLHCSCKIRYKYFRVYSFIKLMINFKEKTKFHEYTEHMSLFNIPNMTFVLNCSFKDRFLVNV